VYSSFGFLFILYKLVGMDLHSKIGHGTKIAQVFDKTFVEFTLESNSKYSGSFTISRTNLSLMSDRRTNNK